MNHEMQDQVDRYVLGQMEASERAAFERQLDDDSELRALTTFTQQVRQAATSRGEKLRQIAQWRHDDEQAEAAQEATTSRRRPLLYWASGVAALLVLGFVLRTTVLRPTDINEPAPTRGGSYHDIEQLIDQGQLDQARAAIDEAWQFLANDSADIVSGQFDQNPQERTERLQQWQRDKAELQRLSNKLSDK